MTRSLNDPMSSAEVLRQHEVVAGFIELDEEHGAAVGGDGKGWGSLEGRLYKWTDDGGFPRGGIVEFEARLVLADVSREIYPIGSYSDVSPITRGGLVENLHFVSTIDRDLKNSGCVGLCIVNRLSVRR
jgi:hypothetical protein